MSVLPVYNMITLPGSAVYLKTDHYKNMTGKTPFVDERVILVQTKEEIGRNEWAEDSFYPIGISGSISEVNREGYLVIRLKQRMNIDEIYVLPDQSLDLSISRRPDVEDLDETDAAARLKTIKAELIAFSEKFQWGEMIRGYASNWKSIGEIAAAMSPWMMNSAEEKYELLAEDSLQQRFDMTEKMIYENLEISRVQNRAKSAQEEEHQKLYRESAVKKQIEYLQKELDDMHPENVTDIRRLEIALEESVMNEEARKEASKVLNRLKNDGQNSAEAGMLQDYLEFLLSLPWEKEEARYIKPSNARDILSDDHYGLDKVKKRIVQQIAVMNLKKKQSGSILLFVGAPGTGKTSIGQSIARALDRKYSRVSLGGVRDEADIRGHRRTYIGAMPGRIMDGIAKCGVSNPVMVLDEVDKLSASYNGDPASALLEVLDPEQNSTFTDHYLNVPYDLSDVFFICTANTTDTIPEPLLNRMEVIRFQGYTPIEKEQIALLHLLPKAKEAVGLSDDQLEVTPEAVNKVIADYTREGGVRGLKKCLDTICRNAAVEVVDGRTDPIRIDPDTLPDYLEELPMRHKMRKERANAGIVTGLAWTSVGGDVLYVETMLTKGSGKVTVTGRLGDVMKESAQIAISLVKAKYPEKAELFEDHDLHIHVPDGATPKDGPSAGITLTSALASLVSGIPIGTDVAMTGEVSLRGGVNPIGGLPEKLMAAQRFGIRRVFIPADNTDDLKEVADEVKEALEIIPVSEVDDVLKELGLLQEIEVKQAV